MGSGGADERAAAPAPSAARVTVDEDGDIVIDGAYAAGSYRAHAIYTPRGYSTGDVAALLAAALAAADRPPTPALAEFTLDVDEVVPFAGHDLVSLTGHTSIYGHSVRFIFAVKQGACTSDEVEVVLRLVPGAEGDPESTE